MRKKVAKMLKKAAQQMTIGKSEKETKRVNKRLKKVHNTIKNER